jgi:hypothetical protein
MPTLLISLKGARVASREGPKGADTTAASRWRWHLRCSYVLCRRVSRRPPTVPSLPAAGLASAYEGDQTSRRGPGRASCLRQCVGGSAPARTRPNHQAPSAVRSRFADLGLELTTREQQRPEGLAAFQSPRLRNGGPLSRRLASSRNEQMRGKAIVALARRLAVITHRIWVDGTEFRWTREVTTA